jgi:hypothetical protein
VICSVPNSARDKAASSENTTTIYIDGELLNITNIVRHGSSKTYIGCLFAEKLRTSKKEL